MRTLSCKHKILGGGGGGNLKPHLITFLVFNVLETWRLHKLMTNLGIDYCYLKIVSSLPKISSLVPDKFVIK